MLEDLNASIKVSFTNIEKTSGFFCEGCIVLVQGSHLDGLFKVSCIAQPPISWLSTEPYPFPSEKWSIPWPDHSFVIFLSNVHLDDQRTLNLLDNMFKGYSNYNNIMFVFIGNFSSSTQPNAYNYKAMFEGLLEMISKYENLKESAM